MGDLDIEAKYKIDFTKLSLRRATKLIPAVERNIDKAIWQLSISRGNYQKTKDKKDFFGLGNLGKDDLTEETADKYQEFKLSESVPKIIYFKLKKWQGFLKRQAKKSALNFPIQKDKSS